MKTEKKDQTYDPDLVKKRIISKKCVLDHFNT
jgi:hypothetical protein